MFQHILVPLDGSDRAERVVPIVAQIARASNGSVHLLQVEVLPINYGGGFSPAPLITQVTIDSGKTEAKEYLQGLATAPHLAAIATTTEVLLGTPAYEILAAAERRDIDLIVLCSHGRTGLTRWVLGSVASTLVRESAVPTLVLREQDPSWRFPDPDRGRLLCALVPLDGSELAEAALTPAAHLIAALAAPEPAALHLVQVVPFSQEEAENKASATRYLTQVAERLRVTVGDLCLTINWSVISDRDVASALVSLAEQGRDEQQQQSRTRVYDLIALSTHGRGGFARWVMGSIAQRLLTTTTLPLLVVRPPQRRIHHVSQTRAEEDPQVSS